jgi:hypothetical protein
VAFGAPPGGLLRHACKLGVQDRVAALGGKGLSGYETRQIP